MGRGKTADTEKLEGTLRSILAEGETVLKAVRQKDGCLVLTSLRAVLAGAESGEPEFLSVPYRHITGWSAGVKKRRFRFNGNFRIFIAGRAKPACYEIKSEEVLQDVQRILATYCK